MIKWLLHKMAQRMTEQTGYDNTYLHEIIDVSNSAALKFLGLPMLSQTKGPNVELWAGAAMGSVLDGDCGPCAQLVLDEAVMIGVPPEKLRACLQGKLIEAGDVGLGYRFANASIHDLGGLEELRNEIVERFGPTALIAASYTSATSRAYPVLKRGLGHGDVCQKLTLGGETLSVNGSLTHQGPERKREEEQERTTQRNSELSLEQRVVETL